MHRTSTGCAAFWLHRAPSTQRTDGRPLWECNPNAEPAAQRLKPDATAHGTAKVPRAATDAPALNRAQTAFLRSPTHVKGVH